jgi:hypothetical protein
MLQFVREGLHGNAMRRALLACMRVQIDQA